MNERKLFLGFRFFGGRHTRWANSCAIDGELVGFFSRKDLIKWLDGEKIGEPCGLDGGERINVTRQEAMELTRCYGKYMEELLTKLRFAELQKEEREKPKNDETVSFEEDRWRRQWRAELTKNEKIN